jgi:hypothetical protein
MADSAPHDRPKVEGAATQAPPPLCRLSLLDEARIVDHGEELVVWYVREGEEFTKAGEAQGAEPREPDAQEDAPPGIVWRRTTELLLPRGSVLMKRVTAPRITRTDPLEYLTRGNLGTHRSVREAYFRVTGNYRIEAEPLREKPPQG